MMRTLLARTAISVFLSFGLLTACMLPPPAARGASTVAAPDSGSLVTFASSEGLARLARADATVDFPELANQFEAQSNAAFCGPTTAAIVLNALQGRRADLPRDRGRLRADDLRHLPPGADLSLPRYTQDNVIERGAKTRAQVLGEPMPIAGTLRRDVGYQLRQFDEMLRANGARTRMVVVDAARPSDEVRADLIANLRQHGDYAIVAYHRARVGQPGGGHISPLGAYDAVSDSFLVMDVNPASAGWVWMSATTLIAGMRTFDTVENRGYVLIAAR
jgi:hypothetical protein